MSIQVCLNGLSFCVLNTTSRNIEWYFKKNFPKNYNPVKILEEIESIYNQHKELENEFKEVVVLFSNDLYALVPRDYFVEDEASNYLKFNTKILKTDVVSFDELQAAPINCVYIPYINITNYFFDKYGEYEYRHSISQFLDAVLHLQSQREDCIYINVYENYYDLVVLKNNKFVLSNTFQYETVDDFIYYILFTAEQLKLDREQLNLYFVGYISQESDYFQITYKYIKNIELLDPDFKINQSRYNISSFKREAFLLLNSLGCE